MQEGRSSNPFREESFCKNTENAVQINDSPRFSAFTSKKCKKYAVNFFSTAFLTKIHRQTSTRETLIRIIDTIQSRISCNATFIILMCFCSLKLSRVISHNFFLVWWKITQFFVWKMRLVWFHTRKFSSCDEKLHDFSGEWM